MGTAARGVAVILLIGSGCSSDPGTASDPTVPEPTPSSPSPTGTTLPAPLEITTAPTDLGVVLVDGDGYSLYISLDDPPNLPLCVEACAQAWAPVSAEAWTDSVPGAVVISSVPRPDGTTQLAAATRPLYRFAGDLAPGEVTGQGVNGVWFVVDATGQPVLSAP
jgi:predicted lipoprotein with Yx(FWY)xxD motif